jgi:sodium-dependent dicarboxylate transporter 2/3/5
MLDTRRHLHQFIDKAYKLSLKFVFTAFSISFLIAYLIAYIPNYSLSQEATSTLFILLFAAGLWVSEAIPAFAVSLLIVALEIVLLGFPGFNFAEGSDEWKVYLQPWSSPLIFLFLAGFIMAAAASKTKLDIWLAKKILFLVGSKPHNIITGLIGITFVLSMFISNTATAAMMMSILIPILSHIKNSNPFRKSIFLAVMIGANLGGMSTIIGTPPNAIAVGILGSEAPTFIGWMFLALPPALFVTLILRFIILRLYPSTESFIDLKMIKEVEHFDDSTKRFSKIPTLPSWKKYVTMILFTITIVMWLTGPLHHIPTTVVSLIPIIGFTMFGIIDSDDIASIRWDVIILIIGGLSLGLAVSKSGLDMWLATLISTDGLTVLILMFIFSYLVVIVSNFMSNTAATNIMLPIVIAIALTISKESTQMVVVAVTLSASFAMSLAVSTPPNAIIYASKKVDSKDFLILGAIGGVIGPLAVIAWLYIMNNFIL